MSATMNIIALLEKRGTYGVLGAADFASALADEAQIAGAHYVADSYRREADALLGKYADLVAA